MTRVRIRAGACGFSTRIMAEKDRTGAVRLTIESDCEMVRKMAVDLAVLDRFAPLAGFGKNPVHAAAVQHLKHAACAVPSGILKAVEVEAGLNVPKDAAIEFDMV